MWLKPLVTVDMGNSRHNQPNGSSNSGIRKVGAAERNVPKKTNMVDPKGCFTSDARSITNEHVATRPSRTSNASTGNSTRSTFRYITTLDTMPYQGIVTMPYRNLPRPSVTTDTPLLLQTCSCKFFFFSRVMLHAKGTDGISKRINGRAE